MAPQAPTPPPPTPLLTQVYAGRLQYYISAWSDLTHDEFILSTVRGYKIPLLEIPNQNCNSYPLRNYSTLESHNMQKEISKLLKIGAIKKCKSCQGQFISDIFLVPKSDGSNRFILNLKKFNKYVSTEHFKMEDIRTATKLLAENDYMANIDLKDAYLFLPILEDHRKYLRFIFKGNLYEFTALPFGLSSAPFIFTKIMQPVFLKLRSDGLRSVRYLDDALCIGKTKEDCLKNINETIKCLTSLGFIINYKKSSLTPSKRCKFLGFILDSEKMTLELPNDKKHKILNMVKSVMAQKQMKIRDFASFLGTLTAACPAVEYGWSHTKSLERCKYLALLCDDDYNKVMTLSSHIREDLHWWKNTILNAQKSITSPKYVLEIFTDASMTGWGAMCNNNRTGGQWTAEEGEHHINYLELLAVYFGLRSFANDYSKCDILLRVDNTTAISYINRMGGVQFTHLNKIAKMIWDWCEAKNIYIFASYIKSKLNVEADAESRKINIDTEWQLCDQAYTSIIKSFGEPNIDLFASRINAKCTKYISWKRDPFAYDIDAFTINWQKHNFYAFPPFSLILKVLNKIISDRACGIVVVPYWPSQPWYPLFMSLSISEIMIIPPHKHLLSSTFRHTHPLHAHLSLAVSVLCGKHSPGSSSHSQLYK